MNQQKQVILQQVDRQPGAESRSIVYVMSEEHAANISTECSLRESCPVYVALKTRAYRVWWQVQRWCQTYQKTEMSSPNLYWEMQQLYIIIRSILHCKVVHETI